jgi:hypothetical protein
MAFITIKSIQMRVGRVTEERNRNQVQLSNESKRLYWVSAYLNVISSKDHQHKTWTHP